MHYNEVLETSVERHNADVTWKHISHFLWTSHNKFYANIKAIFYVSLSIFTAYLYVHL